MDQDAMDEIDHLKRTGHEQLKDGADETHVSTGPIRTYFAGPGEPAIQPGVDTAEQIGLDNDEFRTIEHETEELGDTEFVNGQAVLQNSERGIEVGGHHYGEVPGANSGSGPVTAWSGSSQPAPPPKRPLMRREGSTPAPQPVLPAPDSYPPEPGDPTDSLTLMQLKNLRAGFPKEAPPQPYAFEYKDAQSLPAELEEWFNYSLEDQDLLDKKFQKINCVASYEGDMSMRSALSELQLNLPLLMIKTTARLRWDDVLPTTKILLLTWKSILVCLGGTAELEKVKVSLQDVPLEEVGKPGQPLITASPLDYHLFRQEITSKYPAYQPPPPLFALEPEQNSILPPLRHRQGDAAATDGMYFGPGPANINSHGASILHQPVHIATPAPSPPPSPAGPGGKGGKKQNYQTNQMFPFLYPPLDTSSNYLGGKGATEFHDAMAGRKWEGSDIPASILEAAQLFATRMRATRAMKQLWKERVEFMKYERGWRDSKDDNDVDELELSSKESTKEHQSVAHAGRDKEDERLQTVETLYKQSLPHLQSMSIVLLKEVLNNVTAQIVNGHTQNGLQAGTQFLESMYGNDGKKPSSTHGSNGSDSDNARTTTEELDAARSQEIAAKALSGILTLLLKWFKVSHILKFEYLAQLLLDSNYIPLVLKLWQTQDIERVVSYRCEREELNLFQFCRSHSRQGVDETDQVDNDDDDDDAAPPPVIKLRRDDNQHDTDWSSAALQAPRVNELGQPTTDFPPEPITNFSWRNFFSSINYLHIMHKICKNKAHRNLLLMNYKSDKLLKKSLEIPQPDLRRYTLKLIKDQTPFCGRKWRQNNMSAITAVYLTIKPELRDDWLAGSDVETDIAEALPLEQALRALTHWHNVRRYPEMMGVEQGILNVEQDFFAKELEKMDLADPGGMEEEGSNDQAWEPPLN
ncbi:hypothetical protein B0A49_09492, partial [Cryomyces minteri]